MAHPACNECQLAHKFNCSEILQIGECKLEYAFFVWETFGVILKAKSQLNLKIL